MAKLHGKNGSVIKNSGTAYVENVKSFTLDDTADTPESTDFTDAGVKSFKVGGTGWAGSYECFVDDTVVMSPSGSEANLTFKASSSRTFTGDVIIGSSSTAVGVDGLEIATINFQGTGVLAPA